MKSRILTVPNQLTFRPLAFLPFFIMAIHYERYNWALVILIVAGFTDALDGFLARGLNQNTPVGAYPGTLVASAVILVTLGYMSLPPSMYGKATKFFEITMIFLVLVLALWNNRELFMVKEICGYCVA